MKQEEILKLKKLIRELESYKGRHTELISVYVPAGANIVDVANQLFEEKGTASNIKSKTTRKNVLTALEKIIQHLKLFRETPPNGLVVFCGNISPVEGKEDIRLWSFEPPEKLSTKLYWCDQVFVLDPLKEMLSEKEIFGLIVLDAREANIGLLEGKKIVPLKHLESTVPSKTVKGGMCVEENTLVQLEDGSIIPIKELSKGEKILSYSFANFKPIFTDSFEIFKRKTNESYKLVLKEPSSSLILTPEHKVFVVGDNGIEEKSVEEINVGDKLLFLSNLQINNEGNNCANKTLAQLLGYMLGDGTVDNNRIILYDKDVQLLKVYKKFAESIIKKKAVILKRRNSYELRLYKKSFVDFLLSNFPEILKPRRNKNIDSKILTLPKKTLKHFIRGLFDAEAYVDRTGIGLRMTNESIVRKVQLILVRYNIVASVTGPDKFDRYELRITNPIYIKNFKKEIGFSSSEKMKRLSLIIKRYRSGKSIRVPLSGILVRKLIEKEGFKKEHFKRYSMFLVGKRNMGYPPFKRMVQEFKKKFKNVETLELLNKICSSGIVAATVKEKRKIESSKEFYDLYVPNFNSFVANGLIVHNSQGRYDRLREDAINEFLTKVGEEASNFFLKQGKLVGIIVGGPGPIKERFVREGYLNYMIQKKVLGIKDTGYTGEYGLEELVKRSEDLIKETALAKERDLMKRFFVEISKDGLAVYGEEKVKAALNAGAVETLLISEEYPSSKAEDLLKLAEELGVATAFISVDTSEGKEFFRLGGVGALLRFKTE